MPPNKYNGTYEELQEKVRLTGISGQWRDLENGTKQYKADNGATLNWYTTKTIQVQGKPDLRAEFESAFGIATAGTPTPTTARAVPQTNEKPKIFIVHGHDRLAVEQLEFILVKLGLEPYILQNNNGQSRTLIEALEQEIYKDAAFAVVLMTPDDFGYSKTQTDEVREPRARQNVILEMGIVMAALGRKKTAILQKGNVELPSDIGAIIRLDFNDHVQEVAVKLARHMKGAEIEIPDDLIAHAAS